MCEPQSLELPENVLSGDGGRPKIHSEHVFFSNVFRELKKRMGSDFEKWSFTLHYCPHTKSEGKGTGLFRADGRRNALILLADERGRFTADEVAGFDVIFQQYLSGDKYGSRHHPFPVAYQDAVGLADFVNFEDRKIKIFFSGYLNRNRVNLYKQFRRVWWLPARDIPPSRYIREFFRRAVEKLCPERDFSVRYPSSIIRFTEWFGKGLAPADYAAILSNTQIAVCPPGFISSETIRHWEAMRLGCVIISAPLPENIFYKNCPIITIQDWSQIHDTLKELVGNPEELKKIHTATVIWWRDVCCENAVANYMMSRLKAVH
jgi:hypothetical protein